MFDWQGLPETIDTDFLNFTLINQGSICWCKINGKIYALFGNIGGKPNEYYFPTKYIIANPVLGSYEFEIDKNCVPMYNTTIDRFVQPKEYESPLQTLIDITSQQLTEVTISALTACKNIRAALFISAKDEQTAQSAKIALGKMYNGEPDVIFKDKIIESLSIIPNPAIGESARALGELREQYQFYLAQFYNAIGINANYNMKREKLNTAEVNSNTDSLLINIIDMLNQRQIAVEKINTMFGTNISVDFSEQWKDTEAFEKGEEQPEQPAESFDTETEPQKDGEQNE